jgi:hypothetical protein
MFLNVSTTSHIAAVALGALYCLALAGHATAQPTPLLPPGGGSPIPAAAAAASTPVASPSSDRAALSYLQAARTALGRCQYDEAGEALERAETRLLGGPSEDALAHRAVLDIRVARQALADHDSRRVQLAIDDAMTATSQASPQPPAAPPVAPVADMHQSPPGPPPATYALLPGHWRLSGWQYEWVPPDTIPRRVEDRSLVQGHYVWRGGRWEWVPTHFGD